MHTRHDERRQPEWCCCTWAMSAEQMPGHAGHAPVCAMREWRVLLSAQT